MAIFGLLSLAILAHADSPLRALVESGNLSELRWPDFSSIRKDVATFYLSKGYSLVWTSDRVPTQQARSMIALLQNGAAKGLDPEDYDGSRWARRLGHLRPIAAAPSEQELAGFDLALTVSGMRYVAAVRMGRVNPRLFCFGLDVSQKNCDLSYIFSELAKSDDVAGFVDRLEPQFRGYRRTLRALQTYIKLAQEDDGELFPATKKPVEPGDPYPGVARLVRLLRRLGDLPAAAVVPGAYVEPLVSAVKHFQLRHGLDPDGRLGPATLSQLNTPLKYRVRQIELTLERWRWVPSTFSQRPIVVNIPEFRLRALNDRDEAELEMKVVVGKAYRHQTPVFSNNMTHVIFRPYWNVPYSIQRAELVPHLVKDPSYLYANDYEIVDARGKLAGGSGPDTIAELRSGTLAIRQRPGAKNALGLIKFMFPNEYNVYLHGTPAQALFSKSRRDFSHGCIRVEKPEELAEWVLRGMPEWTPDRIREAENGKTLQVNLARSIPVLILYGTAIVSESGEVSFFDDIYGHDASLDEVLTHGYPYSGWQPPAVPRDRVPRRVTD